MGEGLRDNGDLFAVRVVRVVGFDLSSCFPLQCQKSTRKSKCLERYYEVFTRKIYALCTFVFSGGISGGMELKYVTM